MPTTLPMPSLTAPPLDWALWYASRGYRIFPCHTPTGQGCSCRNAQCDSVGKHPRLKGWQTQATTDPAILHTWWGRRYKQANIGLATGHTCWVLDVDCSPAKRGDLTLEALTEAHGPLPPTPLVHSGGGGLHYYFQLPSTGVIGNRVSFAPGLDTRALGGLIILPPSRHGSGLPYVWDTDDDPETTPVAQAPDWLLALILQPQSHSQTPLADDAPIVDGLRNETLSKMAFDMRKAGMSLAEILTALAAVNGRCVPPLTAAELQKIVDGKQDIHPDPIWTFHTNGTTPAPQRSWRDSTPWEEIATTQYPLRQWLIKDLIPHGLTIIGGAPKSRKTTIAYDIALATVGQGLALNYWGCMPGGALYCTCEDERGDTKKLVSQLRPQMPATPRHALRFANRDEVPTLTEGLLEYVRDEVQHHQLSLVILDPLMYLLDQPIPRGVDPFLAMKRMLLPLHWLASELQFALVCIDHTRKASAQDPDIFTTLYGSQGKQAIAYTLIMVSSTDAGPGAAELTLETKGRGVDQHKFLFTCTQDKTTAVITWTFGGADHALLSGSRQRLVLQAFANAREAGVYELGARDVVDYAELQQSPATYNNMRQALFQMRRKKILTQMKSGLFAVLDPSTLPSPTPADDDAGIAVS